MQKVRSALSGESLNLDQCVISIMHKPKTTGQEMVNEQHAYLYVEHYPSEDQVEILRYDLVINYNVKLLIVRDSDYSSTIETLRDTVDQWASDGLCMNIIINQDSGESHILSGDNIVLWNRPVSELVNTELKSGITSIVADCLNNKARSFSTIKSRLGELYTTHSGHYFSAIPRLKSSGPRPSYEASYIYDELSGGNQTRGKHWTFPEKVADYLLCYMRDSEGKPFDYNIFGKNSILPKVVDCARNACNQQAENSSNGCVSLVGAFFGESGANITRTMLAGSGHNCITKAIELLKLALKAYASVGGQDEACDQAFRFLMGGVSQYIATVTTNVLNSTDCTDGTGSLCQKIGC